jgi:flagellar hook-length control protein FliK
LAGAGQRPAVVAGNPAVGTAAAESLRNPVGSAGFADELAGRVLVYARGNVQSAHLTVQPPELGPVQVSIALHGTSAQVAFTASHPDTRLALEAALPRLEGLFAQGGLQLAGSSVGGGGRQDQQAPAAVPGAMARLGGESAREAAGTVVSAPRARALGLIDTFA